MVTTHNLGFPRVGAQRQLKFALEQYWRSEIEQDALQTAGQQLRAEHWQTQAQCNWLPVGDFAFYDQVLDMSFLLGHLPDRIKNLPGSALEQYFRVARGRANNQDDHPVFAGEMTKWFDTNYHYIVPELTQETQFKPNFDKLLEQVKEAKALNHNVKPVLIGPVTYLWLSKSKDETPVLDFLPELIQVYQQLLIALADQGIEWVQIDEPILVTELAEEWQQAFRRAYAGLNNTPIRLLLTTYFGQLGSNLTLASELGTAGIHLDVINAADEVEALIQACPQETVISLGVINGRNIWKTDLNLTLEWLEPIAEQLQDRLWLAPSCSLLHVPVDLATEEKLDPEIKDWLAFAHQKLAELDTLKTALNQGRDAVADALKANQQSIASRNQSARVHKPQVKQAVADALIRSSSRLSVYQKRSQHQAKKLALPAFPTTTIGSFPQTTEIRRTRAQFKKGALDHAAYQRIMKQEIKNSIDRQEALGLDVLVHGEAERNDMVEYFGEQLDGYAFSQNGWVQSYGSRCVKPPILFGDITRPKAMTVEWISYAQSLTEKPMKGMLTGPVTMLNWSFVRDDQSREASCYQLALAIRDEVLDLEQAGIGLIQIDEAALREGLPLRQSQWQGYLDWAIKSFQICANGVGDETQIHTHMCYSEFNDILPEIAKMDADVITIETSRSDMELLDAFDAFNYPNQIGPGVYDIHSPNVPEVSQIVKLMDKAALRIPKERLWINPDCGLKTRQWNEVEPALKNMVEAAKTLRAAAG